jgi:hypothetical protein
MHENKQIAIDELDRPRKLTDLATFLTGHGENVSYATLARWARAGRLPVVTGLGWQTSTARAYFAARTPAGKVGA